MTPIFRLYWLRENGRDAGTRLRADQLDPRIQDRVLALVSQADCEAGREIAIRLPFFDRRNWRRRHNLPIARAVRDRAAQLALTHPAWSSAPYEHDPNYFDVWQAVSLALQSLLRRRIAEEYFCDLRRYQERENALSMLAYQTARLFYGREPADFAYDLRDFPERRDTLESTWKMTGQKVQAALRIAEGRLKEAGMPVLARRYAPLWFQDVIVDVRKKPRQYVDLIARESLFINAIIDLGTRTIPAINRFGRAANLALRSIYGLDLRTLALEALDETTRILEKAAAGTVEPVQRQAA